MMNDARALKQLRYHLEINRAGLAECTGIPEERLWAIEHGNPRVRRRELRTLIDFMFDHKPQGETAIVRN